MKISDRGLALIERHESFRAKPYKCPAGKWTIGFGHVILPHESFTEITLAHARELLRHDVALAEACINSAVKAPLSQDQFDALVSLVFNIGTGAFLKSTFLRMLNHESKAA